MTQPTHNKKPTTVMHSIGEWLKARNAWKNTLSVITPQGATLMCVNGQMFSSDEYFAANPEPVYEPAGAEQINGKPKRLLYGVKAKKK